MPHRARENHLTRKEIVRYCRYLNNPDISPRRRVKAIEHHIREEGCERCRRRIERRMRRLLRIKRRMEELIDSDDLE